MMPEKRELRIEVPDPMVVEILRRMTPEERIRRAFECTSFVLKVVRNVILSQHPEWDRSRITQELIRRMHFVGIGEID